MHTHAHRPPTTLTRIYRRPCRCLQRRRSPRRCATSARCTCLPCSGLSPARVHAITEISTLHAPTHLPVQESLQRRVAREELRQVVRRAQLRRAPTGSGYACDHAMRTRRRAHTDLRPTGTDRGRTDRRCRSAAHDTIGDTRNRSHSYRRQCAHAIAIRALIDTHTHHRRDAPLRTCTHQSARGQRREPEHRILDARQIVQRDAHAAGDKRAAQQHRYHDCS
jgi:hypothetical protein